MGELGNAFHSFVNRRRLTDAYQGISAANKASSTANQDILGITPVADDLDLEETTATPTAPVAQETVTPEAPKPTAMDLRKLADPDLVSKQIGYSGSATEPVTKPEDVKAPGIAKVSAASGKTKATPYERMALGLDAQRGIDQDMAAYRKLYAQVQTRKAEFANTYGEGTKEYDAALNAYTEKIQPKLDSLRESLQEKR